MKRPAIIHPDHHRTPRPHGTHAQAGAEWQKGVRRRQRIRIECFTRCRGTGHFSTRTIPACHAMLVPVFGNGCHHRRPDHAPRMFMRRCTGSMLGARRNEQKTCNHNRTHKPRRAVTRLLITTPVIGIPCHSCRIAQSAPISYHLRLPLRNGFPRGAEARRHGPCGRAGTNGLGTGVRAC